MIAAESLASGASPTEVARRHGIGTGQLYTWRRALLSAQPVVAASAKQFARVHVVRSQPTNGDERTTPAALAHVPPAVPPARPTGLIEIGLRDGTTLRVDAQVDARALRRVLAALRG